MTVRKRGTSWQADFMVSGHRYRETFDTELEAQKWELEVKAALKEGKPVPAKANGRTDAGHKIQTLEQLFDHVSRTHWKLKRSSTALIASARKCVEILGKNFQIKDFTRFHYDLIIAQLVDEELSNATINRKLAAMSVMVKAAVEMGVLGRSPKVPIQEEGLGRTRFLTEEEETKVLATFLQWGREDVYCFTVLAIDTGGRLSALLGLGWGDFGHDYKTVTFWKDKKSPPRTLPMTERARQAMRDLRTRYPDSAGPFKALGSRDAFLRTDWDRMCAHLKLDDVVIHTLRHTCASRLVQRGVDLRRVQVWMGHLSIQTTLRYAHLAPSDLAGLASVLEQHVAKSARTAA